MLEACEDRTTPTPVVTASTLSHVTEGGWNGQIRISRDDTTGSLSVGYTVGGTATSGTDHTLMAGSAFFMPGMATVDLLVGTYEDSSSEPTETVILTLSSGSGYTIGSPSSATVNILDNDAQYVYVGVEDAGEDGDTGMIGFYRTGDLSSSLTANFTVGGTATSGTDYTSIGTTVTFSAGSHYAGKVITALADNLVEGTETVSATVTTGTGYSVGSPSSGTLSLLDDPATISVEATDTFEGAATGGFSFTRTGGNIGAVLTVSYSITGTATSGTDYTALTGSVPFAADQDRVEVWVEALGDNTVDDAETVIATLTGGGTTYEIDTGNDDATVTLSDQPQTVSVVALTDGTEGGTNPQFRFTRAGDLSDELTVYYTVTGTATSGTDFTALSGSVTFAEDDDEVDVTVYLLGDSTGEHTETVTLTLEEAEGLLFGNDSDTVFVRDNDTRQLVWTGLGSDGDWTNSDNWYIVGTTTTATPTQYDDVFFNASGTGNVTNVGSGLSTLYGLHITGTYNGTLTLANGLSVGTFEQTAGTLQMLDAADDLLVTHALLWSGGTLGATDDGADVVVDGASARIDPPDTGSMSTSSTLRFIGSSLTTFLPGTLNFAAGNGMYIAAPTRHRTVGETDLRFSGSIGGEQRIEIAQDGTMRAVRTGHTVGGIITIPIMNYGDVWVADGVRLTVQGRYLNLQNNQSFMQFSGARTMLSGAIFVEHGMSIYGGLLQVEFLATKIVPVINGDLIFHANTGYLSFYGIWDANPNDTSPSGQLTVQGNVNWISGEYKPNVKRTDESKRSLWRVTGAFLIGTGAKIAPELFGSGTVTQGTTWLVLESLKGVTGTPADHVSEAFAASYEMYPGATNTGKRWWLRAK